MACLCRLHEQLRYTALPIQQLLRELSYEAEFADLKWLTSFREKDAPLSCPQSGVDKAEQDFLMSFLAPLGKTDLDGQLSHIDACISRAREKERQARERWQSHARLYMTGGVCAGLCAALLLA